MLGPRILFAALGTGGAGGHVYPALAIAENSFTLVGAEPAEIRHLANDTTRSRVGMHSRLAFLPYVDAMEMMYASSDVIVARAGAITCSELLVTATPAILIPATSVAEDHQMKNLSEISNHYRFSRMPCFLHGLPAFVARSTCLLTHKHTNLRSIASRSPPGTASVSCPWRRHGPIQSFQARLQMGCIGRRGGSDLRSIQNLQRRDHDTFPHYPQSDTQMWLRTAQALCCRCRRRGGLVLTFWICCVLLTEHGCHQATPTEAQRVRTKARSRQSRSEDYPVWHVG